MGRVSMTSTSVIVKAAAAVKMRITEYSLILCCLFLESNALDCRSKGGPKENEIKKVYNMCIKQQSKGNNSKGGDQGWGETRRYNQWSEDNARNRGNGNSDYGNEEGDQANGNRMDSRDRMDEQNKMSQRGRRRQSSDNRMQHDMSDDERPYSRNGRGERQNNNGDNRSQRNNGVNDRNDFFQNDNFNGPNNQYSTQSTTRFKREKRVEVNSGKRSQYNPNPQKLSGYEGKYNDDGKNSTESNSTSDEDSQSCAVHCLLEHLHMTDENGMPDRYLVTHTITKDVREEELKDFLQESIEECFQILDNEDTDEKCEFSKSLLMCLSEKGRANCDDWKDDFEL